VGTTCSVDMQEVKGAVAVVVGGGTVGSPHTQAIMTADGVLQIHARENYRLPTLGPGGQRLL